MNMYSQSKYLLTVTSLQQKYWFKMKKQHTSMNQILLYDEFDSDTVEMETILYTYTVYRNGFKRV